MVMWAAPETGWWVPLCITVKLHSLGPALPVGSDQWPLYSSNCPELVVRGLFGAYVAYLGAQ